MKIWMHGSPKAETGYSRFAALLYVESGLNRSEPVPTGQSVDRPALHYSARGAFSMRETELTGKVVVYYAKREGGMGFFVNILHSCFGLWTRLFKNYMLTHRRRISRSLHSRSAYLNGPHLNAFPQGSRSLHQRT